MDLFKANTRYNSKLKAYEVHVYFDNFDVQPLGGTGRDEKGLYPVPVIIEETETTATVFEEPCGLGTGMKPKVFYKTRDAAWKAVAEVLTADGKKVLTLEETANAVIEKTVEDAKERIKKLKREIADLEMVIEDPENYTA